jgi:DNA-binding transcriptional LysR family regulator
MEAAQMDWSLRVDLRHLRNMLAVIEEGSLGKAAQRLNISQPALTKSIQRLEEHLGVRLFERVSRGMKPTFYAESLQGYAKAACVGMAEAQSRITALRNGTEGIITVAAPPQIATEFLPGLLVQLARERPKLQIRIVSQNKDLFLNLLEGRFDLVVGMLYEEVPNEGLTREWLFDDKLVLIMRADHPLSSKTNLRPDDLVGEKWVFSDANTWNQRRLRLYFEQAGLPVPVAQMECREPSVLKAIVAISDYVSVIARLGAESEVNRGTLRAMDLYSPLMQRPIGIVRRSREQMSPAIKSFIRIAHEMCRTRLARAEVDELIT